MSAPLSSRAQVAALPIRQGPTGPEVMLITSRESRRWIVPKGWPMKGFKDHEAAEREALEEAGLEGRIHKRPLGAYTYSKRMERVIEPCRVMVYRLDVAGERSTWRERGQRERQWFPATEAAARVSEPRLASMILACASGDAAGDPQPEAASAPPQSDDDPQASGMKSATRFPIWRRCLQMMSHPSTS